MISREQALDILLNHPLKFAHMLGFTKLTSLHEKWIKEMVRGTEDKTLMAHRSSYKTTCVSIALSENIILLPRAKTMFMRKTDDDIKEVIKQVQKILLDPHTQYLVKCIYNVSLGLLVQSSGEIDTNLSMDLKGTSQLIGIGTGGSLTGKHFDRIFTDDIINAKDRTSKAERDRIKLIYQELQNIKNRGGRIFNTLTPWHKDDTSILMPNIEKYDCYMTGLISDIKLAELRQSMTASLFAANYELKIIADEDVIFASPQTGAEVVKVLNAEAHIDAAYGGADYTAFTVCKKHDGKYYVFGKLWNKHVDDCVGSIAMYAQELRIKRIICEDNGDRGYLAKELNRQGVRARTYHETQNKYIKITTYLRAAWKDVIFVEGTDEEYINQICDFNENADHDDACFKAGTIIATLKGNVPIEKIKVGDKIITPAGIRTVISAGKTKENATVISKFGLNATPNHRVYSKDLNDFIPLDSLKRVSSCSIIGFKELIIWKTRLLYSMGKNISETQRADIISSIQHGTVKERVQNSYTERFGNTTMEKYLANVKYITLMAISTIMIFPIWSVYLLANIYQNTAKKIGLIQNIGKNHLKTLKKLLRKLKNGIVLKRGKIGIKNTLLSASVKSEELKNHVIFAEKKSKEQFEKDFVVNLVQKNSKEDKLDLNLQIKTEYVKNARRVISQEPINNASVVYNAKRNITVNTKKADVYNLTIEKAGCYYANGILVSNCDSLASLIKKVYFKNEDKEYVSVLGLI